MKARLLFIAFLCVFAETCAAQFSPLPSLSTKLADTYAGGITKDGTYIVGWSSVDISVGKTTQTVQNAAFWNGGTYGTIVGDNQGYDAIGDLSELDTVSNDRNVMAAIIIGPQLIDNHQLVEVETHLNLLYGAAPDGSYLVGSKYTLGSTEEHAFIELPTQESMSFFDDTGYGHSVAFSTSNLGKVTVGQIGTSLTTFKPCYWDSKGLHIIPGIALGNAQAVNSDGTIIAGVYLSGNTSAGFLYHPGDAGPYRTFASPFGQVMQDISEMSDDGTIVVGIGDDGVNSSDGITFGWIWDSDTPSAALEAGAFLASKGDGAPKPVVDVTGVSADGRTIVGNMQDENGNYGWKAVISLTTKVNSLTLSPNKVQGGTPSTGTLTIGHITDSDLVVNLASSNKAAATVPATVTVLAGEDSATFKVTTLASKQEESAIISATDPDNDKLQATLTIIQSPIESLDIVPSSVAGGIGSQGTVVFSTGVSTDEEITLASNATGVTVPASVVMAAGLTSVSFPIKTTPTTKLVTATIGALCEGISVTNTLYVQPDILLSVTTPAATASGGSSVTGMVNLNGPAPAGVVVTLSSSNTALASVPTSVPVAQNATSAPFTIVTHAVAGNANVIITGTYMGSKTKTITILAPVLSAVSVKTVSLYGGNPDSGTVTLGSIAPAAGVVVTLTSSNPAAASVPASVKIAGALSAPFAITTHGVGEVTTVGITAKLGTVSKTATFKLSPAVISVLTVVPTTVTGGISTVGNVYMDGSTTVKTVVTLSSSNPAVAKVAASATIAAQSSSIAFTITTFKVTAKTVVTITVKLGSVSKTATVTVVP
jgi:hypothetical protein